MSNDKHIHVTSHNQQGGITAYQVNLQQGDRVLNDASAEKFGSQLSQESFDTIDLVAVMGDQEAFRFASQIKNWLVSEGHKVNGVNLAVFSQPVQGQIIEKPDKGGMLKIIIGGR